LKWGLPPLGFAEIAFLDRMAITFGADLAVLALLTLIAPLKQPVALPEQSKIDLAHSTGAKFWGVIVVLATLALYWKFW
jgi:SSS family solute:Na+ symporter